MSLSLLSFIQLQGMGWLTWVIVGVIVLLALFLIFFFVKGIKKAEKETDDEWGLSQRSLFTNVPAPPVENPERAGVGVRTAELEEIAPPPPRAVGEARNIASPTEADEIETEADEIEKTELLKSVPAAEPEPEAERPRLVRDLPPVSEPPRSQPAREERGTELLASKGPERVEPTPFDDEVWAGLEIDEQPPVAQTEAPEIIPPAPIDARVDHRRREMFEPPVIESVKRREPFEPPFIEPLKSPDEPPVATGKTVEARPAAVERDVAPQERRLRAESEAPIYSDEAASRPAAPEAVGTSGQSELWRTQRSGSVAEARRGGSILNLPAEASDAPLVFGEPAADRDERAIGSLSNYGKDADAGKGRKWIGLVVLLGVIAAAALLYFFVRPINERVDNWFDRVRGRNIAVSKPVAPEYKARVFLPKAVQNSNSNIAKARGQVVNTSDAPLEGLSVEVELVRNDGAPPDIRTASVDPPTLAPKQPGIFVIDLDPKVHTSQRINKLLSKDGEVSFTTPGQNKPPSQPPSQ